MTEGECFRKEAEECLRQAERAVSPLDRVCWLRMAQGWTKLAKEGRAKASTLSCKPDPANDPNDA